MRGSAEESRATRSQFAKDINETVTLVEHDMTWTKDKPSSPGWYWYRQPDFNMDKPMSAWVFDSHRLFYAQLMPVHERSNTSVIKNVKDYDAPVVRADGGSEVIC